MRFWKPLLLVSALVPLIMGSARATLSTDYTFAISNVPYAPLSGATTLAIAGTTAATNGTFNDAAVSGPAAIGFPFIFDGVSYTTFSVNTNGLVMLGGSNTNSYANDLATVPVPAIATWWDHQHMYDGGGAAAGCPMSPVIGVSYIVTGTAPNRVLSVEFSTQVYDNNNSAWWAGCGSPMNTYQVRMYERSNRIEMHYKTLWASSGQPTSGSIGLSAAPGNFISVTPNGGTATTSSAVANNVIAQHVTPVSGGTVYTFTPCQITVVGRTAGMFDGGTLTMASDDTLLVAGNLRVGQNATYTPADLTVPGSPCVNRSYQLTISGPAAGDYYFGTPGMMTTNGVITAGGPAQTPAITFAPTAGGQRLATLTLTDLNNGSTISWVLGATGAVPKLGITANGQPLDTASQLFTAATSCVGDQLSIIPLDLTLTGTLPVTITSIEVYRTDTTVVQGEPRYKLSRDAGGRAIPMTDYAITESSFGVVPNTGIPSMATPKMISGDTRLYLTFNPQRIGPRFARVIIRTDAQNFSGQDTNGVPTQGILDLDVFGRGEGAILSSTSAGHTLQPVDMGNVAIGQTSRRWVRVVNAGNCLLRINRPALEVASGDVGEFRVEQLSAGFAGTIDDLYYSLLPGSVDSMLVSFSPKQIGSRRASVYFRTNDSAVGGINGIERGAYILDLNGSGAQGLYASVLASPTDFNGGVIGDTVGPFPHNVVHLTNNGTAPVTITSLGIADGDSLDFRQMTGSTWPTTPFVIEPGTTVDIPIEFRPLSGTARLRSSCLEIMTLAGDTIDAILTGTAGTRQLMANPTTINYPVVRTGRMMRRTVMITNSGTLPVKLVPPTIGGANPTEFEMGPMPRLDLAPGQVEFFEVIYRPTAVGTASATVTFGTNATTGPITITLNGTANATRYNDDDPDASSIGDGGIDRPDDGVTNLGLASGVGSASSALLRLYAVTPNPASSEAEVRFTHAPGTSASLFLVDVRGSVVWNGTSDAASTTERTAHIPVANLPAGTYLLRVTVGTTTLVQSVIVAH